MLSGKLLAEQAQLIADRWPGAAGWRVQLPNVDGGWVAVGDARGDERASWLRICGPHGAKVGVSVEQGRNGKADRLRFSGWWPQDADGRAMSAQAWGVVKYDEKAPTAAVSSDRSVDSIATSILNRFLTEYLALHAEAVKVLAQQVAFRGMEVATREWMEQGLGPLADLRERHPWSDATQAKARNTAELLHMRGSITAHIHSPGGEGPTLFSFELERLNTEQARAVIATLRETITPTDEQTDEAQLIADSARAVEEVDADELEAAAARRTPLIDRMDGTLPAVPGGIGDQ